MANIHFAVFCRIEDLFKECQFSFFEIVGVFVFIVFFPGFSDFVVEPFSVFSPSFYDDIVGVIIVLPFHVSLC